MDIISIETPNVEVIDLVVDNVDTPPKATGGQPLDISWSVRNVGAATGLHFGFSFNVVTNARGGDNTDDDPSAARTIQGSLRQFLANANAIAGTMASASCAITTST